jgi:phosphohistidine phosphatase
MDIIFWRHAEARDTDDGQCDMSRVLTSKGEKQATRMAAWLDRLLPDGTRVLASPAVRCEQTAMALQRKYKIRPELAPGGSVEQLLSAAQWPDGKHPVLVVGHQPVLGQAIAKLLTISASECVVKRGAVWWLRNRDREGDSRIVVVTVQAPEIL